MDSYPCSGPDDCASAQLLTENWNPGDTTGGSNTFPSYSLWAYPLEGNDHVYTIEIPCPGYEVCVSLYPNTEQDVAVALSNECVDGPVTAVAGAGYYYIMADSYYSSGPLSAGDFDLDVAVTPATPVDTFDISMVCDSATLTLPTLTKVRIYVDNTFTSARQFCGNVGVTLCNGAHISNLRPGNMVVLGGETKFVGWGQYIPALPRTCDCTLVFNVDVTDCTPCAEAGLGAADWNETATCGVTTYCP